MKKLFSLVLAVLMIASLSTTAFAATNTTLNNTTRSHDITVTASYNEKTLVPDVISVYVIWDQMAFDFTKTTTKTWDPVNHVYDDSTTTSWKPVYDTAIIDVENHSNVPVTVGFTFSKENIFTGEASFTNDTLSLAKHPENSQDTPKGSTAFSLTGGASEFPQNASAHIGTITITISKTKE